MRERSEKNVRKRALQTARSVKKESQEVLQLLERHDSCAASGEDHGEAGCHPVTCRKDRTAVVINNAAHDGPHNRAGQ